MKELYAQLAAEDATARKHAASSLSHMTPVDEADQAAALRKPFSPVWASLPKTTPCDSW